MQLSSMVNSIFVILSQENLERHCPEYFLMLIDQMPFIHCEQAMTQPHRSGAQVFGFFAKTP